MTDRHFQLPQAERDQICEKMAAALRTVSEIVFAIVHGSFHEGLAFEDIDVALYLTSFNSEKRLKNEREFSLMLEKDIGLPADVQILNCAPLGFQHAVTSGRLLFTRDPDAYYSFREQTWLRYLDHKYFYEQSLKDLLA